MGQMVQKPRAGADWASQTQPHKARSLNPSFKTRFANSDLQIQACKSGVLHTPQVRFPTSPHSWRLLLQACQSTAFVWPCHSTSADGMSGWECFGHRGRPLRSISASKDTLTPPDYPAHFWPHAIYLHLKCRRIFACIWREYRQQLNMTSRRDAKVRACAALQLYQRPHPF